jgi:hypothetical protein
VVTAPVQDLGSLVVASFADGAPADGPPLALGPMTTVHTDEVIIIAIGTAANVGGTPSNYATVASITGGGLTFARRAGTVLSGTNFAPHGDVPISSGGLSLEYWWAHAPTTLINVTFDVTLNSAVSSESTATLIGFGIHNLATPASPWDPNGALPVIAQVITGQPTIAVSTTDANDLLLGLIAFDFDPTVAVSGDGDALNTSGWTGIFNASSTGGGASNLRPSLNLAVQNIGVSAVQSGRDATWPITQASTINANIQIGDALVGPGSAPPASVLFMDNVVVTSLGTESPCTALNFTTPPPVAQSPSLGLRWSDTRGQTFGNAVPQQFSTDPLSSYQWNRTGYARDRVFELFWSAAFKTALNGAFIDVRTMKS